MKLFTYVSSILFHAFPKGIKINLVPRLLISLFISGLLLINGKAFSQSADIDQGENGSATSRKTFFWQNGNLGPSGAHFAEGYSIPYRMKISGLTGGLDAMHTLVIEWDTKDQNGHALDYLTHYDNMDNPVGSHQGFYGHAKEDINPLSNPTTGTTYVFEDSVEIQIPTPSSNGAEVAGMPGASFLALPGASRANRSNATKMSFWGANSITLAYSREDNQDATTASTKSRLTIRFKSNNGTTALVAWGGHIAAEYDWLAGRGASKVSGSPYHMRLVSIDGKPGSQDRSLKATAVFVPTADCSLSAALTACSGTSGPLVFSFTGSTTGITNYAWTLTPSGTNAIISGGNTATTKSGASVTSISVIPEAGKTFAAGQFTVSLTLTNKGGTSQPCTTTGTISEAVVTDAGPNQPVCASSPVVTLAGSISGGITTGTWSGGTGTFSNANSLTSTYTPSAAEIAAAGTVTLTLTSGEPDGPCAATSDEMVITINKAVTTNAGGDRTVCASSPVVTLAGSVSGGITTGTWSGGTGTFSNANSLTSTYTPSAAEIAAAGTVTLTLTSGEPDGPCAATSDEMVITINKAVTTNAGGDRTVCASSPVVTLAGSVSGGITTGTWSGGTGTFSNANSLTSTYTPSAAEIAAAGTVTLTLTSGEPDGPCAATSDEMVITINKAVTTNAGGDRTVCASSPVVTLAGSVSGGITTGTWSGGTGTFSNANSLTSTYTPSAAEIAAAGTVTLTLTSGEPDGPCAATSDEMVITINKAVTTNAGGDRTVCASSPVVTLAGSVSGGITTGTWSGGTGTFSNANSLTSTYTPSAAEIAAAGTVTLTLTSGEPDGPCAATSDQMVINITANPSRPTAQYIAPDCDETTFSVKVTGAITGGIYTLTQDPGGVNPPARTAVAADNGEILFEGLTIGKGFSVNVKVGDCTSEATHCDNYKDEIITAKKPVIQQAAKEVAVSGTKVTAAPNPFNEKIRFSITPTVTGRASLELYNLLGEKVKTVFNGQVQKGQVQTIEYNVPFSQRTTLIYMYRSGNEKVSGKLIGLR